MSDLLAGFDSLQDEYYPGSKQKRRESKKMRHERVVEERREVRALEGWDAHPIETYPNGVKTDMFRIGALAKALGRDSVTIRSWIRKGWLPRNMYQTPAVYGSRGNAGRRLFTRAQIEGIIQIAKEEGVLGDHPVRLQTTNFTQRVFAAWRTWK